MKKGIFGYINLSLLQTIVKGSGVFYFVLLPVFYEEHIVNKLAVGYWGGLFIFFLILGAFVIAKWAHRASVKKIMIGSSLLLILAAVILYAGYLVLSQSLLMCAFIIAGFGVGIGMSGVNTLAGHMTKPGDRYTTLAALFMMTDLARIIFPLIVSGAIYLGFKQIPLLCIIFISCLSLVLSWVLPNIQSAKTLSKEKDLQPLRKNKTFLYTLVFEFLDSLASSQLFVFLPFIFLAKGYSLESSILLQSCIFGGYLCGRWVIGFFAKRSSGTIALMYSEFLMGVLLILLLITSNIVLLYVLTFILGIFARGTSPVIKGLTFDALPSEHMTKGSAMHVIAGDSGSAIGQFVFGLLFAWYSAQAPFIAAIAVSFLISVLLLIKPVKITFV